MSWLSVTQGQAPLIVSLPHTGTHIPPDIDVRLEDTDWFVDQLYDFAAELGATAVRTSIARTVIDVNRDPSGASLYPGQATTELCPTTTFDGEPLQAPDEAEIARRRTLYFEPYHAALAEEIARLRATHLRVVVYDAHSIRSVVPRLFDGELPHFNIGTNSGASCDAGLTAAIERACDVAPFSQITNGRFKGGWITRRYGQPATGVHAVQMELACRGYMDEAAASYDPTRAAPMRAVLTGVLAACLTFARETA